MMHIVTRLRASRLHGIAAAVLTMLCAFAALSFQPSASPAATPIAVAVADFDYFDTSGEVTDQSAEHRDRVASFEKLLRDDLAAQGVFIAAARKAGARLVVYGGVRKMSTLVQWGEIQLLDLEAEKLLMRRTVTFRGDNDAAYRHAANFVGDQLKETMPKP